VNLKAFGERAGGFQADFQRYWRPDQVARQVAREAAA
jgi:hypothetical protein